MNNKTILILIISSLLLISTGYIVQACSPHDSCCGYRDHDYYRDDDYRDDDYRDRDYSDYKTSWGKFVYIFNAFIPLMIIASLIGIPLLILSRK